MLVPLGCWEIYALMRNSANRGKDELRLELDMQVDFDLELSRRCISTEELEELIMRKGRRRLDRSDSQFIGCWSPLSFNELAFSNRVPVSSTYLGETDLNLVNVPFSPCSISTKHLLKFHYPVLFHPVLCTKRTLKDKLGTQI